MAEPLLIMRHGQAEPGFPDPERRLSEKGEKEARRMGRWLAKRKDLDVTRLRLVASPYVRAQQTAALVAEALADKTRVEPDIDTLELITPDDSPQVVIDWLLGEDDDCPLILVSHMPLVAALTGMLIEGRSDAGIGFSTAAIAELHADVRAAGCSRLVGLMSPSQLK